MAQDLNSIVNDAMVKLKSSVTRTKHNFGNGTLGKIEKDLRSFNGTITNSTTVRNQSNMVIDKTLPMNAVQFFKTKIKKNTNV
jgi:hypothetical protein